MGDKRQLGAVDSISPGKQASCEQSPIVALVTDAGAESEIPIEVRCASDRIIQGGLSLMRNGVFPEGSDGALLWVRGDQLLEGSSARLRRAAVLPNGGNLVPVHLPCLPELDLLGLQRRIWNRGQSPDVMTKGLRFAGAVCPSAEFSMLLEESPEPWAVIYRALLLAQSNPPQATKELFRLWEEASALLPVFRALLLSNMVVLVIRDGETDLAAKLAALAMDYFPRCADLAFLSAWIAVKQVNLPLARRYAQQAMESGDASFAGRGGERSYRSQWLLGLTYEIEGKQAAAVRYYLHGARRFPAFPPSVLGLLRQRLSFANAQALSSVLLPRLVRREPQYLEVVFHFMLLHRQLESRRRLLESSKLSPDLRARLQGVLDGAANAFRPAPRPALETPGVLLTGPFYTHSGIARVNRHIAGALMGSGRFHAALEPHGYGDAPVSEFKQFAAVAEGYKARLSRLDMSIRHHLPPDFDRAPSGKLVCIVPWHYSAIPCRWAAEIQHNVDEVWVPSEFTRQALMGGGIDGGRIRTIPKGIDTEAFTPEGSCYRPEGCRSFLFLYAGPALARRGADVLWNAYARAFTQDDDVTLLIQESGFEGFDARHSLSDSVRAATRVPRSPHLILRKENLDDRKLAELYRACNVFVLPYRASSFGLVLAEALACGKPVITTGLGPAREFCPPEASYFISSRVAEIPNYPNPSGALSSPGTWFEPDVKELAGIMRYAYEHRDEAALKGARAPEGVREKLCWQRVTEMYVERIHQLLGGS